jgi:hypothetical protein
MNPFFSYRLHQVERSASGADQRLADERAGRLAADIAELRRSFARPAKALLNLARRLPRAVHAVIAES